MLPIFGSTLCFNNSPILTLVAMKTTSHPQPPHPPRWFDCETRAEESPVDVKENPNICGVKRHNNYSWNIA